jgi:hypothetical protein
VYFTFFFLLSGGESGCIFVILTFRRLRQEDCEFEASLGYITSLYLNPSLQSLSSKKKNEANSYNIAILKQVVQQ